MAQNQDGNPGCGKAAAVIGLVGSLIAIFTFLTGIVSVNDLTRSNTSQGSRGQASPPVVEQSNYSVPTQVLNTYKPTATPEAILIETRYVAKGVTQWFSIDVSKNEYILGKTDKFKEGSSELFWEEDNDGRGCVAFSLLWSHRHYDFGITSGEWRRYKVQNDTQAGIMLDEWVESYGNSPDCSGTYVSTVIR